MKIQSYIKTAIITLLILIVAGLGLSMLRDDIEKISNRSYVTPLMSFLEHEKPKDKKIVFLGSSRIKSCIKTDLFSKLSGIDKSKIIVLQSNGAGTWEELLFFRKLSDLINSSTLVIIEVDPWMFNKNFYPIGAGETAFLTWSTFKERLEFPNIKMRSFLMLDYFYPISQRRSLEEWGTLIYLVSIRKV